MNFSSQLAVLKTKTLHLRTRVLYVSPERGTYMSNPSVTVELPNGTVRAIPVSDLLPEVKRLALSGAELGYELVLRISTTNGVKFARALRLEPVSRESKQETLTKPFSRTRSQHRVDLKDLEKAMDADPNFSGHRYAKKYGFASSAIYNHMKKLKSRKSTKKR
jgi:hypothetical protein